MTLYVLLGTKPKDKPFRGWQEAVVTRVISIGGWVNMKLAGITTFENPKVKIDYSEYLGPDWEMKFEGYGSVISNH